MLFQNGLRWLHAFPPISVGFARWHTENLPRPSHGRRSLTAEPDRQGSQKHASREAKPYCSRTCRKSRSKYVRERHSSFSGRRSRKQSLEH